MNKFIWKDFSKVSEQDCYYLGCMLLSCNTGLHPFPDDDFDIEIKLENKWIIGFDLTGFNSSHGSFKFKFTFFQDLDKIGYTINVCFENGIMFDLVKCNLEQSGLDPIPKGFTPFIEKLH